MRVHYPKLCNIVHNISPFIFYFHITVPISINISRIPLRLHCLCPEVQVPFSLQRLEFVPVKTNPGWQEYTTVDWKVVVPLILTNSPSVKGSGA